MKIGIDVSQIIYGTGVSVYTKNLVENLLKLDNKNEYILFGGSFRRTKELKRILNNFKGKNVSRKTFLFPPAVADLIWNKLHIINIERLVGQIDVFHSSDWTQPPTNSFKVTTIHDLVPIKYPDLSHPKIFKNQKSRFKHVLKETDRIIVPSSTTAVDVEKMGFEPGKIRVIPEAVDPEFCRAGNSEIENIKRRYRISGRYLLSIGVNARKNTQRIIDAFEKIKGEINIKLVIIGEPFIKVDQTRGVYFLGHVPSEAIASLYSGAEALVYPSLYEGFGIPILEAFACGTPVITSNIGSMAEVSGKASILVDPYNINSIVEGVFKAISNRDKLIERGIMRNKKYSWQKTAQMTLKVYSESQKE